MSRRFPSLHIKIDWGTWMGVNPLNCKKVRSNVFKLGCSLESLVYVVFSTNLDMEALLKFLTRNVKKDKADVISVLVN